MLNRWLVTACVLATSVSLAEASPKEHHPSRFGVTMDVGAPDGGVASLVYRPVRPLRVHAGVGHNLVSTGLRAGVTLVPFKTWATPTLSLDYGRYFEGDANGLARMLSGDDSYSSPLLERVGYDYANAHLGLELGNGRVTFYLHAGASRITSDVQRSEVMTSETSSVTVGDAHMTLWTVSGRMGLLFYL
jgi:hypothetical protein